MCIFTDQFDNVNYLMTKNIQIHIKIQVDIVEWVPMKVKSGYRAKKFEINV